MKKLNGRRLAALILIVGFVLTLSVAANAEPLRAESTASAKVAKALPHHYLGKITAVNTANSTFTLDLATKKVVVATTSATKFQTYAAGKKTTATFADVKLDGKVAIIGELKGSTLTAKIVFIIPAKTTHRHADRGTVTALSGSSFTYTPTANKNSTGTANVTGATVFTKKEGGKITRVLFSSLAIGDRVTFVGVVSDQGVITAKLVHVIPGLTGTKTSTSSAQ